LPSAFLLFSHADLIEEEQVKNMHDKEKWQMWIFNPAVGHPSHRPPIASEY
jgi:hypothetical protein